MKASLPGPMPIKGRSPIISKTAAQTFIRKLLLLSSRPAKILVTRNRKGSTKITAVIRKAAIPPKTKGSNHLRQNLGKYAPHQRRRKSRKTKIAANMPIQPPRLSVKYKQAELAKTIVAARILGSQSRHTKKAAILKATAVNK